MRMTCLMCGAAPHAEWRDSPTRHVNENVTEMSFNGYELEPYAEHTYGFIVTDDGINTTTLSVGEPWNMPESAVWAEGAIGGYLGSRP